MNANKNMRKVGVVAVGMLLVVAISGCGEDAKVSSKLQGIYTITDWTVTENGGGSQSVLTTQPADMLVVQMDQPFPVLAASLCIDGEACDQTALNGSAKDGGWRLSAGGDEEGWAGRRLDFAGVSGSERCAATMAKISLTSQGVGEIRIEVRHLKQAEFERATCTDARQYHDRRIDAEPCVPDTCSMYDAQAACQNKECELVEVITARFTAPLPRPEAHDDDSPREDYPRQPQ